MPKTVMSLLLYEVCSLSQVFMWCSRTDDISCIYVCIHHCITIFHLTCLILVRIFYFCPLLFVFNLSTILFWENDKPPPVRPPQESGKILGVWKWAPLTPEMGRSPGVCASLALRYHYFQVSVGPCYIVMQQGWCTLKGLTLKGNKYFCDNPCTFCSVHQYVCCCKPY